MHISLSFFNVKIFPSPQLGDKVDMFNLCRAVAKYYMITIWSMFFYTFLLKLVMYVTRESFHKCGLQSKMNVQGN